METVDKTCEITAKQSCLPVTALEFITIGQSEHLLAGNYYKPFIIEPDLYVLTVPTALAGEGPYLKLLSCDERVLLAQEEVLPFRRVHGIRPGVLLVYQSLPTHSISSS